MRTRLVRIGNSQGIVLPKKLLQQYRLSGEVELHPTPEGLLTTPVASLARQGWEAQMQTAMAAGQKLEGELLEGFSDAVLRKRSGSGNCAPALRSVAGESGPDSRQ